MNTRVPTFCYSDRLAWALTLLYALERLLKLLALWAFFRRPPPPAPTDWPAVTLICPITRSPNDLRRILAARAQLDYPGAQRCLLICDAADVSSQTICRELIAAYPAWRAELLMVAPATGLVADKITKQLAALGHADGELLCFVDDDVLLRPDALRVLVPYALMPMVGAAFGLACYTAWGNLAESLLSGFVNTNALLSYVPLSWLVEPFTITGHCFIMARDRFAAIGGLKGMDGRLDDDHELARRVRRHGLRIVQTPLIYEVENRLANLAAYHNQMRRWMLIPRQALLPELDRREQAASTLSSVGMFLPPLLLLLALVTRRPTALAVCGLSLLSFTAAYALSERGYLAHAMPVRRWLLLPWLAWATPLHVLLASLGDETISWRGQRLRIARGGRFTVLGAEEA